MDEVTKACFHDLLKAGAIVQQQLQAYLIEIEELKRRVAVLEAQNVFKFQDKPAYPTSWWKRSK